jgi:hypothetical protein
MASTTTEAAAPTGRGDAIEHTGCLITSLQDAGYSHTEIIDALLWEAAWMIEVVANGRAAVNKEEVQRLVSEFSWRCEGLIERPRECRRDRH